MRQIASSRLRLATGLLLSLGALPAYAQMALPGEHPLHVYDNPSNAQSSGAAAIARDGTYLLLWKEWDGTQQRLLARRHRASGTAVGNVIEVAPNAAGPSDNKPQLSMAQDGAWVAVWTTEQADGAHVFARVFTPNDVPTNPVIEIAVGPGNSLGSASVAMGDSMDYWVAWEQRSPDGSGGIYARRYILDAPQGDVLSVAEGTEGMWLGQPRIVTDAGGGFLVTWSGVAAGGTTGEVFARQFAFDGTGGTTYQVSSAGGDSEWSATLARGAGGATLVAWDVDGGSVRFRALSAAGEPVGAEVEVAKAEAGETHRNALVGLDDSGDIALAWTGYVPSRGTSDPYLQRYSTQGTALGERQRLNEIVAGYVSDIASLVSDPDGDLIAMWNSRDVWTDAPRATVRHVSVPTPIDLSVEIDDGQPSVSFGSSQAYQVRVRHNGDPYAPSGEGDTSGFLVHIELSEYSIFNHLYYPWGSDWTCNGTGPIDCQFHGALIPGDISSPIVVFTWAPDSWATLTASAQVSPWYHQDPEGSNNAATDTTVVADISPEPFTLSDLTEVERNTMQVSDPIQVYGIDVEVMISVWGGEYSINGGEFTAEPGLVRPYDSVRVRHLSAPSFYTTRQTSLYIGDTNDVFETRTVARDAVPDAFAFVDRIDVARGLPVESAPITVSGINDVVAISVIGGSYSINGGAPTTQSGTVQTGDTVRAHHVAASAFATRTDTRIIIGGVDDLFSSTTVARDVTPDAFAFPAQSNVLRGSEQTSAEVIISGINDAAPVSVIGGSYSIDGGAFTSTTGTIANGQRLRLRHTADAAFSTTTTTTVTVGTANVGFSSTTEAQDAVPSAFVFVDRSGVATAVEVISDPITVAGINVSAPISVAGGSYSINGGAFTTAAGTVAAGDLVRVKHVSASSANTAVTTTLTIGGVSDGFTSTTGASDSTPNAYAFADVTGAKRNKAAISVPVTVTGINVAVPISVTGGGARWSKNGGAYTTAAGTVVAGDVVRLQVTMPNTSLTTVNVQVNIGGVADTWSVTTGN